MPLDPYGTNKYAYAYDLATALWGDDVDDKDPSMLYADLEEAGYTWTGDGWYDQDYLSCQQENAIFTCSRGKRPANDVMLDQMRHIDMEKLEAWNAGKLIKG